MLLVDETPISKPPEPTMHHNSIKLLILLPLRADLLCTLQYETPCIVEICLNFYLIARVVNKVVSPHDFLEQID